MAELLVNVQTGEVVHVAEDGHQWGRQECREVYDAYVAAMGAPPVALQRGVYTVTKGIPVGDGKMLFIDEFYPIPMSESFVPVPPPSKLGVVTVAGVPASEFEYLLETNEDGERLRYLSLTSNDRSSILAGKVPRSVEQIEAMVMDREVPVGD